MISEQAINDVAMIARNGIDRIIELESMVAAARDHAAALQSEVERLREALTALFAADMEHVLMGDGKDDQIEAIAKARAALQSAQEINRG